MVFGYFSWHEFHAKKYSFDSVNFKLERNVDLKWTDVESERSKKHSNKE